MIFLTLHFVVKGWKLQRVLARRHDERKETMTVFKHLKTIVVIRTEMRTQLPQLLCQRGCRELGKGVSSPEIGSVYVVVERYDYFL